MTQRPESADFDLWRKNYATMCDTERRAWDARCYEHYPEQAHGNADAILRFVASDTKGRVVEVGGWRGDHAAHVLKTLPLVVSWTNIEFCQRAAETPKTTDPRYRTIVPVNFRWWQDEEAPLANLLVLSHVIEHLSPDDLMGLLDAVSHIPRVYVEAPLPAAPTDWSGYLGTHILPWTWKEVEAAFGDAGYAVERRDGDIREFRWGASE